jgi:threonine dehydratase
MPVTSALPITLDDVRAAQERIKPIAHRTPVMTSESFNRMAGVQAFFKCENLQKGGAFKIRGAANRVLALPPEELKRGVIAYSSGNHAQAVALAARFAGVPATVVMPDDAPGVKVEATLAAGAQIVRYDRLTEDREAVARAIVEKTGATIVPPFDHPHVMAGQGTLALELLQDVGDLDAIVLPIGGGGMVSGCAVAAKGVKPGIRVFGVEPETANDAYLSMKRGERVVIDPPETIADGLRTSAPGKLTLPVIQALVDDILLVTEDEIREAVRFFAMRMKIVVEPSGAVPAAAVLHGKLPAWCRRVGVVISGGNVDPAMLAEILRG